MSDWRKEWHQWIYQYPPEVPVLIWREEWITPVVCLPSELHPSSNVWGLMWKLTGIGRERIAVSGDV